MRFSLIKADVLKTEAIIGQTLLEDSREVQVREEAEDNVIPKES